MILIVSIITELLHKQVIVLKGCDNHISLIEQAILVIEACSPVAKHDHCVYSQKDESVRWDLEYAEGGVEAVTLSWPNGVMMIKSQHGF